MCIYMCVYAFIAVHCVYRSIVTITHRNVCVLYVTASISVHMILDSCQLKETAGEQMHSIPHAISEEDGMSGIIKLISLQVVIPLKILKNPLATPSHYC